MKIFDWRKLLPIIITGILAVLLVMATQQAYGGSDVSFSWDANSEPDLAGYRLYGQTVPGSESPYTRVEIDPNTPHFVAQIAASEGGYSVTTYTLLDVPDGPQYWVLTAFDTSMNESPVSNEVSIDQDTTPPAPPGFRIDSVTKTTITTSRTHTVETTRFAEAINKD